MANKWVSSIYMVIGVVAALYGVLAQGADTQLVMQPHCEICFGMLSIKPGKFFIGATEGEYARKVQDLALKQNETPRHEEHVDGFYLANYDVTRKQFSKFASATGFDGSGCKVYKSGAWQFDNNASWKEPGFPQTDRDPVVCVSWNDAIKYISWLNREFPSRGKTKLIYRLPTEIEWEYAARAGTQTATYWSEQALDQCKFANARDVTSLKLFDPNAPHVNCVDGFIETSPVGLFERNQWGLFDMLGDVYQWTSTCSSIGYQNSVSPPSLLAGTDCSERVVRGASWATIPSGVRSARRSAIAKADRASTTGFRVAADISKQ